MSTVIKFSLDGGITFQEAKQGLRIVYEHIHVPGEDQPGEVHLNVAAEGVITDVWVTREEYLDHNIGTRAELLDDLVGDLIEAGA